MQEKATNVLIFSPYLPDQGWGGGVIIRSLTQGHPANCRFYWATFSVPENQLGPSCNGIEVLPFRTRHFRGRGVSDTVLKVESKLFARDFNAFLKQHEIDLVWVVLGTSYDQLYLTDALAKTIGCPFHVSVHDDPILEIRASKKEKASRFFNNILSRASGVDVISVRMQQRYLEDYGVDSIVITRCIPDDFPQNDAVNNDCKTILMGGYGNASAPWPNPLTEAVELLNVRQKTVLHLFDSKLKRFENERVKVHDLRTEKDFNTFLKTVDLGYACDDLRPENLKFAQLSLPTKVITYIGASIPFLYHGPKNSTVGDLIGQYEAGIIVDTNNAQDIAQAFDKLLSGYAHYQENCRRASENLFSRQVVQQRFFEVLLNKI